MGKRELPPVGARVVWRKRADAWYQARGDASAAMPLLRLAAALGAVVTRPKGCPHNYAWPCLVCCCLAEGYAAAMQWASGLVFDPTPYDAELDAGDDTLLEEAV